MTSADASKFGQFLTAWKCYITCNIGTRDLLDMSACAVCPQACVYIPDKSLLPMLHDII